MKHRRLLPFVRQFNHIRKEGDDAVIDKTQNCVIDQKNAVEVPPDDDEKSGENLEKQKSGHGFGSLKVLRRLSHKSPVDGAERLHHDLSVDESDHDHVVRVGAGAAGTRESIGDKTEMDMVPVKSISGSDCE